MEASCLISLEPTRAPHVLSWIASTSGPEEALQTPVLEMGEGTHREFAAESGGRPGLWISILELFPPCAASQAQSLPQAWEALLSPLSLAQSPSPCPLLGTICSHQAGSSDHPTPLRPPGLPFLVSVFYPGPSFPASCRMPPRLLSPEAQLQKASSCSISPCLALPLQPDRGSPRAGVG